MRARILNRDVAVISSHAQVCEVLGGGGAGDDGAVGKGKGNQEGAEPAFVATAAYDKLMGPFFPAPNVLLADGAAHTRIRQDWDARISPLSNSPDIKQIVASAIRAYLDPLATTREEVDLYALFKALAWRILLGIFLGLSEEEPQFKEVEKLQEELLRGQFSVFPVSVSLGWGWWRSARKRGIDARVGLQGIILGRLKALGRGCPVVREEEEGGDGKEGGEEALRGVADHVLLFTSSLAVKGLASLLLAVFLNLFLFPGDADGAGCVKMVREGIDGKREVDVQALRNVLLETERLSPPIVGVMRRATRECVLKTLGDGPDTLIPKGWDVWVYGVGAGRDPKVFGSDCDLFKPERYGDPSCPQGFAFGTGPKTCLGQDLMRDVVCQVAQTCVEADVKMSGSVTAPGVRGWLGWDPKVPPEQWAADMKQLPTQHPAKPIMVTFSKEDRS